MIEYNALNKDEMNISIYNYETKNTEVCSFDGGLIRAVSTLTHKFTHSELEQLNED